MRRNEAGAALAVEQDEAIEALLREADDVAAPDPIVFLAPDDAGFRFDLSASAKLPVRAEPSPGDDFRYALGDDFGDEAFDRPGGERARRPSFFIGLSGSEPEDEAAPDDWAVGVDEIDDGELAAAGRSGVELRPAPVPDERDIPSPAAAEAESADIVLIPMPVIVSLEAGAELRAPGRAVGAMVLDAEGIPIGRVAAA